jgi:hypothetical protein
VALRVSAALLLSTIVLSACGGERTQGQSGPTPVVEALPATTATADVDTRATLALKQAIMTRFPASSDSAAVEAALLRDGFTCSDNPTAPGERACLRAKRDGTCEINSIIRTQPYVPDKAQVIKICEIVAK